MPYKAPRLCKCGAVVPSGARCECEARGDAERKARHDLKRPSSSARGYTSAWEKARKGYLERHPHCVMCGKAAVVVDHKKPHKGDVILFWDKNNWQALCIPCHSSAKQRLERGNGKR